MGVLPFMINRTIARITQGWIQGGGGGGPPPPPKIGKNMIFWRKKVIFHTKYPKNICYNDIIYSCY